MITFTQAVSQTKCMAFYNLQDGDPYATLSPRNNTLQCDLQYIDESDKFYLFDILKYIGKSKAILVSVFTQDYNKQKEQMYLRYSNSVHLEEV